MGLGLPHCAMDTPSVSLVITIAPFVRLPLVAFGLQGVALSSMHTAWARSAARQIQTKAQPNMQALLKFSRSIDAINALVGRYVIWLILVATVVSGVNAVVRKVFSASSNAALEVQWYLFAAAYLLAAGYTLLEKEHVKVDVLNARLSLRTRVWIDVFGFALFLTPMCVLVLYYAVPFFWQALQTGETSGNAGGLIRWPVYLMMPLGFGLLLLQGVSEFIKRVAFLLGLIDDPTVKQYSQNADDDLAQSPCEQPSTAASTASITGKNA